MLVDWLAFPLLVLAVSVGCGLLVERIGGWRIPGAILPGVGLAAVIVTASLTTHVQTLAPATPWIVVALTVVGYGLSVRRVRALRVDPWAAGVGILVFLAFAAPVLAYGHPDFLGYGVDGDPAFHFLYARYLIAHGYRPPDLLPFQGSATGNLYGAYLSTAYPFGGDVAVGALRPLIGQDIPWIYAPFLATALAGGGLALYELLDRTVRARPLRALCAFIAAQAGLTYSFFLISSIKELLTTVLVTLTVVLVVRLLRRPPTARGLFPLLVVGAAELYDLAIPGAVWIAIPIAGFVVLSLVRLRRGLRRPRLRPMAVTGVALACGAVLILPVLASAATSLSVTTTVLTSSSNSDNAIGNLLAPLNLFQIMGIWPNGDYRLPITLHAGLVYALIWLAIASAILGALWTLRRRAWGPLALLAANGIVIWVLLERSTPYAASKVMAIGSVTAVLAAMLGAVALSDLVRPWLGWTLAAILALAVLWTNSKSFRQAPLGPAARFAELSRIDQRFRSQGPTYYDMWDEEWPGYFLRTVGPFLPHLYNDPTTVAGTAVPTAAQLQYPWDLAEVSYGFQIQYRLIVAGRSPQLTRPPADYRLVYQGRFYDVFRRVGRPVVLRHEVSSDLADAPLYHPRRLSCTRIQSLGARAAREHAHLAASLVPQVSSVKATASIRPPTWMGEPPLADPVPNGLVLKPTGGTLSTEIDVPRAGRYTVWLQGNLTQRMSVAIALHHVGDVSQQIGPGSIFTDVGTATLPAGRQPVILRRDAESPFIPTSALESLGEVALTRTGSPPAVHTVAPSAARSLCGRRLQWLEIVR